MLNVLPPLSKLTSSQKDDLIIYLFGDLQKLRVQVEEQVAQIQLQTEQIQLQAARIQELENLKKKNSSNSSKPPSSDSFVKKTRSLRRSSGKKVGGQTGHKGHALEQVSNPDETIILEVPTHCEACQRALEKNAGEIVETRQVFDIPVSRYIVKEFCAQEVVCTCGCKNRSAFPAGVDHAVQYGPDVRAASVHLTQVHMMPYVRSAELIESLYGLPISAASLLAFVAQAGGGLADEVKSIGEKVSASAVAGADESGFRVGGGRYWLHTAVTESYTWCGIHEKRGAEAVEAFGVLTSFKGVLTHDCLAMYWLLACLHALCNAHLLRELQYVVDTSNQTWAVNMLAFYDDAYRIWHIAHHAQTPIEEAERLRLKTSYVTLVEEGLRENPANVREPGQKGRIKQSYAHNLLCRLRDHQDAVLRFLHDPSVPFTNNLAEQAIRMPKVKIKIAGCFRTVSGAEHFATIRSYTDTLRKQGISIFEALRSFFRGTTIHPA